MKVKILVDNKIALNGTIAAWGFSAYVDNGKTKVLVDTGPSLRTLENNAKVIGVNLDEITAIFISHLHSDHCGALEPLINNYELDVPVFIPSRRYRGWKLKFGKLVYVSKPMKIIDEMYSTGPLGMWLSEHSFIAKVDNVSSILITGCAHPGIVKILEYTVKTLRFNILAVIGGMHLIGVDRFKLEKIVEKINSFKVEHICPCHCSGDDFLKVLLNRFSGKVHRCGCGVTINLDA